MIYLDYAKATPNGYILNFFADKEADLADTDYIVLKMAEAVAESNSEQVAQLRLTYANELNNRKVWREQINNLEETH